MRYRQSPTPGRRSASVIRGKSPVDVPETLLADGVTGLFVEIPLFAEVSGTHQQVVQDCPGGGVADECAGTVDVGVQALAGTAAAARPVRSAPG